MNKFLQLLKQDFLGYLLIIHFIKLTLSSACFAMRSVQPYVSLIL